MSHLQQRTENNCLNCGAEVKGRYCHQCGQENVETKESFLHLLQHFFEDITHFDGKIWKTIKALLFQPAHLTKAYIDGKRMTYIHPIRMYLFISAIFFLFVFSFEPSIKEQVNQRKTINETKALSKNNELDSLESTFKIGNNEISEYQTVSSYDSAQSKLSKEKKDGWFIQNLTRQQIALSEKYHGDYREIGIVVLEKLRHNFSKILYISLPFAAFFTWLLYRRKKHLYFVDHLIFIIHIYCALFTIIFLNIVIDKMGVAIFHFKPGFFDSYNALISLVYVYICLINMFNEGYVKTFFKMASLVLLNSIVFTSLVILFFIFSLFTL